MKAMLLIQMAAKIPIKPEYQEYSLADANRALLELKERKIRGAKVLRIMDTWDLIADNVIPVARFVGITESPVK